MHAFTSDYFAGSARAEPVASMTPIFLRLPDVLHLTALTLSIIYWLMAADAFPAQHRLGRRCVGWRSEDIAQWIAARPAVNR